MNLFSIFKEKKYLDCPYLKHSIHFFYNEVRACCSNVKGPVFYKNKEEIENINWDDLYKKRVKYINWINSPFNFKKNAIPNECKGCHRIKEYLSDKKTTKFYNYLKYILIQNNMSCNAKCIYCIYADADKGSKYNAYKIIESILKNNLIDDKSEVLLSGGEITITPYFEDLMNILTANFETKVHIATSGIKYSKGIEEAFKKNKCRQIISLDSGTKETYERIKKVDCFEKIKNNIKRYIESSENAKNFTILKYIIIDDVNDNQVELNKFFGIVQELGIKNVQIDVNFEKYTCTNKNKVPEHYFALIEKFKKLAEKNKINAIINEQTQQILDK